MHTHSERWERWGRRQREGGGGSERKRGKKREEGGGRGRERDKAHISHNLLMDNVLFIKLSNQGSKII